MNKLTEWLTKPFLDENVDLPINIGDTVKMGKFKNKKVVVKKIDWNEKGDLLINGRPALKFRLMPKTNIFDKEEIKEGVYDPGIFKAVFLAGGPGSGKTFVAGGLFGIPEKVNVSAYGLKMVNQDTELEMFLKKYFGTTDLDNMSDDLFRQITDPSYSAHMGVRKHAKALSKQRLKLYSQGRLGVIVDGTGHKYNSVKKERQKLINLGYDTYMVFVNTSLEVAQMRNKLRDRVLPSELVEKYWNNVQKNMAYFQGLFGGANFMLVDNNATLNPKQAQKKFSMLVKKGISKFLKKPMKNKIAKQWIEKQKLLKKSGIKEFVNKPKMKKALQHLVDKNLVPKGYVKNIKKLQTFLTNNPMVMTQLLRLLGENINEQKEIKKVVGIYGGRFQPFGPHHKKTYEWLKKQVDDAYITTSDIKQPPRHPMNFKEKVRHMKKMGIPSNRIIKEKTPYVAKNVLKKYDKDTTAVIYIFGAKDAGRLKGGTKKSGGKTYYQDYKKNKNNMNGYEEHGYVLKAPHISVSVGGKEVSGTVMRQLLGSPDFEKDREKLFKKAFGYFDNGIYSMMTNKFKKLFESIDEFLINNDISKLIKESSTTVTSPTDDGPPTFYKGFGDYRKFSKKWIDDMYAGAGWEVLQYILGKHAINPDYDYTLKYNVVPAVAYGRKQSGEYGTRFGVQNPINTYKDYIEGTVLRNLGYKVLKWMGITPDGKNYTGVEVETPVLPGIGVDNVGNTEEDKLDLKERINLDEYVKFVLEQGYKAVSLKTGYESTFDTADAMKKAIKKGTHAKPGSSKAKAAEKKTQADTKPKPKKSKTKPKFDHEKATAAAVAKAMKSLKNNPIFKLSGYEYGEDGFRNDEKPEVERNEVKPGIINTKIIKHYDSWARNFKSSYKNNWQKSNGLPDNDARDEYERSLFNSYGEVKESLPPKEQRQLKKDIWSWKQLGGYEAIQDAISDGDVTEQDIIDRNERLRDRAHSTITKIEIPIERGIHIPSEEADEFLSHFEIGEKVDIPNEDNERHNDASGFSTNPDEARTFSKWYRDETDEISVVMRLLPNKNGEVRGLFIDGEKQEGGGYWGEGEIVRSSKSKAKVISRETITNEHGRKIIIISLQEPDDLSEVTLKEQKSDSTSKLLTKYLSGGLNPKPRNKKKVKEDIKPDVIKSFIIRDSLNTKVWDGDNLKPEIRKKLLLIAKNFFKDLELEPNVKLQDITLTGSISNYNWSKFSDVDLHLRIDFSEVDDDSDFVKNYVLAKKTIWNNKHEITIYGFPVEVYVENLGDKHVASGLYSILKDEWIVVPKKKELQIDLDDIRSKAEGYLGSIPVLQKMMKDSKYDEVVKMVEKIQEKLLRMRSSGLERGGEFSVENLAFKALRRSPFIGDIIQMKNDAYDKKMTMKERINLDEEVKLIIEGGAYGHMNHPFDDKNITFSDLKQIIINGLGGNLNREDGVTEKLDGQNLMVSWVNGKLVTARNKGQLKNFGATSMDIKGVASKFAGRGDIRDAFVFAMKDLNKSIGSLSDKQKEKIFGNGKNWMNLEVMYPKSANVIDYDKAQIVFHGTLEYDKSGNSIGQPKGSARILAGMIKQVNQHVQKHYTIGKPQFLTVSKVQDFGKKKKTYLNRLKKLQNQFKLKDTDTLAVYHQSFWEEFIFNSSKQYNYKIPNKILVNLTKRWAFFDKSYKIPTIKKDLKKFPKFLEWVLSFDKNDHQETVKQNMKPFEVLFFDVGAEILKNIGGYLAASPDNAVQKIRKDVINAIKTVKSGGDIKKIQTLKLQLDKLQKIGGLDAIVPSEGIVFKYKGKTYKFTGAFAPVNQILGLLNF